MDKSAISIIIPAYQPDDKLLTTVEELVAVGFSDILVINDGSRVECAPIFEKIQEIPECTLLVHEVNKGKGAALKTAFAYVAENRSTTGCVVTADADGQHLTKDIEAVCAKSLETEAVVLGTRNFAQADVPARSVMGNRITCGVFRLFFGMKLRDTQTGLRAIPIKFLPDIIRADGDRYEYETNMLFMMNRKKIPYEQVDITTVYIEENKSSHFRVVRDSVRIYALILKYLFSSVAAAIVDEAAFYIFKKFAFLSFLPIPLTFTAAILARVISSLFNFWMNATQVFKDKVNKKTLLRYYALAVVQIALSAVLVFSVEKLLSITSPALSTLAKAIIDTLLFFVSFRIQHKWVFNSDEQAERDFVNGKEKD